jgi:MFS family permease
VNSPAPGAPAPRRVLFLVGLGTALSLLGDTALYAVLPTHTAAAGITLAAVGLLLSANRWIRLLTNGLLGWAYDRFPRRRLFVAALFLGAFSTALYAFTRGFWPLLAGRLLWGLAWSGIWVGGNTILLDVISPADRGRWTGYYQSAFYLGGVFGFPAGGFLTDHFGYHIALALAAAGTLLGAVIVLLALPQPRALSVTHAGSAAADQQPERPVPSIPPITPVPLSPSPPTPSSKPHASLAPVPPSPRPRHLSFRRSPRRQLPHRGTGASTPAVPKSLEPPEDLERQQAPSLIPPTSRQSFIVPFPSPSATRHLLPAALLYSTNRFVLAGIVSTTLGILLQQHWPAWQTALPFTGLATLTGLLLGLSTLVSGLTAPLAGHWSDRASSRWLVAAGLLLPGVIGALLLALGLPPLVLLAVPLSAVSAGSSQGLAATLLGDFAAPAQRGRAFGFMHTLGDFSSALAPTLAYAFLPWLGLPGLYLICALLCLFMAAWSFRLAH